jgi:hypothetical protein
MFQTTLQTRHQLKRSNNYWMDRRATVKKAPVLYSAFQSPKQTKNSLAFSPKAQSPKQKKNYVAFSPLARTIPTERPPLVGEVSANFCG